jgi:periplasmic protein TonB
MFEDSLVESRVGYFSSNKRWTTLASISFQVAVAGVVITLPLLHPEALPFHVEAPRVLVPLMSKPPVPVVQAQREASASSSSMTVENATRPLILTSLPGRGAAANDAPQLALLGDGMGVHDGLPSGIGDGHRPVVSVAATKEPVGTLHVSKGVLQGMLITPIRPVYPAIAKAARVEGTVIVEAVISRTGTIESLHVVTGPQMLQGAAMDAIRQARYQPYRLNGEPTEVQTTITVNFKMGG